MNKQAIKLHPDDNVAVAINKLSAGQSINELDLPLLDSIASGHKIAIKAMAVGEPIIKYGQIIAFASAPINAGEHVHTHNAEMKAFDRAPDIGAKRKHGELTPNSSKTFQGYVRANGEVGTRNYIGVIASVNCSATVVNGIVDKVKQSGVLDQYSNIDGIVPITHGAGCCINGESEGFKTLQRTVNGYIKHPNFAGVLLVGLGCEVNQIEQLISTSASNQPIKKLAIQAEGGTRKTIESGYAAVLQLVEKSNQSLRTSVDLSHLTVALQCGGSDGYSGITANPALGYAVDLLVEQGGTAILSETPEIYGAEHLLTSRAASQDVGEKLLERIHWWEGYAARSNSTMNNNPTPGNKNGGLTTILEKSLGAVAKGGSSDLQDVYLYAEQITTKGLNFMDSPGYDPASITGQVAAGANLICFTTGRGSAYGNRPVPSLKLATNTPLFERMQEDMDINCGAIIDGATTVQAVGESIFAKIIAVASGEKTHSEELGVGDSEFVPWQIDSQM